MWFSQCNVSAHSMVCVDSREQKRKKNYMKTEVLTCSFCLVQSSNDLTWILLAFPLSGNGSWYYFWSQRGVWLDALS